MDIKIFIPGNTPSKKNSKKIVQAGSRPRVISSEHYLKWEQRALWHLKVYEGDMIGFDWQYPLRAGFHYIRRSRHRFDFNNLNQGPLDVLVQAGIIRDDDMHHIVPNGNISWEVSRDNDNLGVIVTLAEIDGGDEQLPAQGKIRKPGKGGKSKKKVA